MIDRAGFMSWIEGYERAWRIPGTDGLAQLFTEDASYLHSPYADPVSGLAAIAKDWEANRDGPDENFTMAAGIVAIEENVGVARVYVRYAPSVEGGEPQEYQDLWVVRFDESGRCRSFEEWPFWPGQPLASNGDSPLSQD